jgi:hypothetical protein
MAERRITDSHIDLVLCYGRIFYKHGLRVFVIGRKEALALPLSERQRRGVVGIQVCTSFDGTVVSVYRNRDLQKLKLLAAQRRRIPWRASARCSEIVRTRESKTMAKKRTRDFGTA